MTAEHEATDFAAFLDLAVRERMLSRGSAKELAKRAARSGLSPAQHCVDSGQLSPIQAEAIEAMLSPQSIAAGYEVVGLLGHGGIGIVYRARQPSLDRMVALKTISTSRLASGGGSSAVARFQQEAVAIAKLKHPNIVTAYDFGTVGDRVYLAMEMVDGVDLDSYIKQAGQLDEISAWRIARQVAAALSHAQQSGIVHRDIKPANLLVTDPPAGYPLPSGTPLVKVTDFGMARLNAGAMSGEETRLTVDGTIMGTPQYMSPEQIEDPHVGIEADIYALGATVYHMITGQRPLAGMPLMKMIAAKLAGQGASLDQLPENVGHASRELLGEMMAQSPNERPQPYGELLARIGRILDDESLATGATIAPAVVISTRDAAQQTADAVTLELPAEPRSSIRKAPWLAAAAATILIAVAAVSWALLRDASTPPVPRYVASERLDATRSLYDGRTTTGWENVAVAPNNGPYAGMLWVVGNARTSIEGDRQTLSAPDHFGLAMQVALGETDAVEVWFETGDDGTIKALRIEDGQVTLGHRPDDRTPFEADGRPIELVVSSIDSNPVLRIDRDEHYWLIRQSVPGEPPPPRLLGWTPIAADAPTEIRIKADGETVYLGEIELVELKPIEEAADRP